MVDTRTSKAAEELRPLPPEDSGGGVGVKAPHLVAQLADSGGHPPDQGHGVPVSSGRRLSSSKSTSAIRWVAGLDADGPAAVGHHAGDGVQVHAGGQAVAVLVVGVVAPQLRAAGGGEKQGLRVVIAGEGLLKLQRQLPQPVGRRRRVLAVDRRQPVQQRPALQGPQQVSSRLMVSPSILSIFVVQDASNQNDRKYFCKIFQIVVENRAAARRNRRYFIYCTTRPPAAQGRVGILWK